MAIEHIENLVDFPPYTTPASRYRAGRPRGLVVLVPAMGVSAAFYEPFAVELNKWGLDALLVEIPGNGESRPRPSRRLDYGYRELLESYLPGLLDSDAAQVPDGPRILLGHSLGAQLGALAVATDSVRVDALVTVAGGHIHYRNWRGASAAKVWFGARLFSTLAAIFGHLPGQYLGFGGPQAPGLIRDWSQIILSGRFSHIVDPPELAKSAPMLSIGIAGDDYAPQESVAALAALMGGEVSILPKEWKGNPHSSWARYPAETVQVVVGWLVDKGLLTDD
jgi:predicted alpha/beta hydrolase